jgi:hypothetical protein
MVKEAIVKSAFSSSKKVVFACLLNSKFEQQHHSLEGNIGTFVTSSSCKVFLISRRNYYGLDRERRCQHLKQWNGREIAANMLLYFGGESRTNEYFYS